MTPEIDMEKNREYNKWVFSLYEDLKRAIASEDQSRVALVLNKLTTRHTFEDSLNMFAAMLENAIAADPEASPAESNGRGQL